VHFDGLVHTARDLIVGLACCHTSRQIRRVRREVAIRLFDYNQKAIDPLFTWPFPCLASATSPASSCCSAFREPDRDRMTGHRDTTWFRRVLVLPVTASRGNQIPTIFFYQLDDFTNLYCHSACSIPHMLMRQPQQQLPPEKVDHHLDESAKTILPKRGSAASAPWGTDVCRSAGAPAPAPGSGSGNA
jgi:hypothetical protein